jgi:signal transduction histidine kinase
MEDHGGIIEPSSRPGIGATVVITFPIIVEMAQPLAVSS